MCRSDACLPCASTQETSVRLITLVERSQHKLREGIRHQGFSPSAVVHDS